VAPVPPAGPAGPAGPVPVQALKASVVREARKTLVYLMIVTSFRTH
jgi:hypothetical protein